MSLSINFNHNWSYCRYATFNDDNILNLTINSAVGDLVWSPVELPHIVSIEKKSITNDNKLEKWWYRKEFQWSSSDQQVMQSTYLTFKSSDQDIEDTNRPVITSVSATVWLNGVKIFSGLLMLPGISIELPQILLNSNQINNYCPKHTLIVCCINSCLSLNAFLTIPNNGVCDIREVQLNMAAENTVDLCQKHDDIHDYVGSIDDIDKRVIVTSNLSQFSSEFEKQTKQLLNTETDTMNKGAINEEKIPTNNYIHEMNHTTVPLLTIVMLIVGTRGDVQPFVAYGKTLCAAGHRVRLATHEKFRKFVREHGLEFFPLGGDPAEIMSFMVKNSGIFPSFSTLVKGNLFKRRHIFSDILESTWLACTSDDDETGASFRPDVIIANPLSYGHVHCAEKLGIPLHMVFTMPSSPTTAFPHPLSNVDYSKTMRERINLFSYGIVETLMWLGIGDLINKFRHATLGLPSLHIHQIPSLMIDEKVPYTYCWSPSLVPKPADWPFYIDVSGYFFLDLASSYTAPPKDLLSFLGLCSDSNSHTENISPPIFIGFGSITGHDSHRLLNVILDALMQTGYRALLSGFDIDTDRLPKTILKIDDVPYDWLFQHVSAVCHHGGAGTTAASLRAGKPSITVPFFGDQFFWGNIVEKSGAGPSPLPGKHVTVQELVEAFKFVHKPSVQNAAKRIQEDISHEDGCAAALRAFHANLPISRMRSDLEPTFAACFRLDEFNLQVSRPVAQVLLSAGVVNESQFRYHYTRDWQLTRNYKSKFDKYNHPHSADLQLNAATAKPSVYYGLKNDTNLNRSDADCRRRRTSSSSKEILVANINTMLNTITDTLLPVNELNQNMSTNAKINSSKNTGTREQNIINTSSCNSLSLSTNNDDPQQHDPNDISVLARHAATISGFSSDVCKHILLEFAKVKRQHVQALSLSLIKHNQSSPSIRQRSQSFTSF